MAEARIEAALLDLDGTLIDSLPALKAAYRRFLEAHGCTGSDEEFERWNGPPLAEVVAGVAAAHGIAGDARALFDEYLGLVERSYLDAAALAPGAEALLGWLERAGAKAAVVTSAPARLASSVLARNGVRGRVATVVGGDDVARGKPAPDGYRQALARLGVSPERAIAVEDSASGVRAARAAGLRCVGVGPAGRRLSLAGATVVARDLDEACAIIEGLATGPGRVVPARSFAVWAALSAAPLDGEAERAVDDAWRTALAERPSLVDGEIVALDGFRAESGGLVVTAELTRYRRFVAQRRGVRLGLVPLGVSGVVLLPDGRVVLGRRAADVTQYPGCWELVPSGGIARRWVGDDAAVDARGALLEELEEELGLAGAAVRAVAPLGLVEDLADGVTDLCFRVEVATDEATIRAALGGRREYEAVELLAPEAVIAFAAARGEGLVPTVAPILDLLARAR